MVDLHLELNVTCQECHVMSYLVEKTLFLNTWLMITYTLVKKRRELEVSGDFEAHDCEEIEAENQWEYWGIEETMRQQAVEDWVKGRIS